MAYQAVNTRLDVATGIPVFPCNPCHPYAHLPMDFLRRWAAVREDCVHLTRIVIHRAFYLCHVVMRSLSVQSIQEGYQAVMLEGSSSVAIFTRFPTAPPR